MKFGNLLALALGAALTFSAAASADDNALRISGSTTVLPIAQKAAENYMGLHPEMKLSVSGTGSGDGIKAIIEGSTDIANSSRELKEKELNAAKEKQANLNVHVVALDCVVPVVNPENPVQNLTLDQLKGLYDGSIKNWKEVGGEDKKVIAINRDVSSGTFEVWLEKVLKGERSRQDAQVQASSGGVAQAVAGNKFAIGYVGLGYLNKDVKAVSVDGVTASVASVRDKAYPISRDLYMITRQGGPQSAEDFIKFITSADGQKLVEAEGFVPLETK